MRVDHSTVISALLPVLVRAWIESEPGGEFGRYNVGNANLPLALAHQLDQLAGKRAVGVSQLLERRVVVAARQFSIGAGKAVQAPTGGVLARLPAELRQLVCTDGDDQ